jgi:hypothetical protein
LLWCEADASVVALGFQSTDGSLGLGREDSNFHITIPKNAFEMSTEFLLIWPKIRLGDFCSFELCAEQTHQWVRRNASLGRSTSVLANSGHKSPV